MKRVRRFTVHERRKPAHDRRDERHDPPQRDPDRVRDDEHEAEEDREAAAIEIVAHEQPNRMRKGLDRLLPRRLELICHDFSRGSSYPARLLPRARCACCRLCWCSLCHPSLASDASRARGVRMARSR